MIIRQEGKNGVLRGTLNAAIFEVARNMPGRRRWRDRDLVFELTRANIEFMRQHLPDATWECDRLEQIDSLAKVEEESRQAKRLPPEAMFFRYKTQPRAHQVKAFQLSRDRQAYGLFLEQGLGKTKVILDTAAHLWAEGKIDTLLIVAPNGVHAQWINEQMPEHFPDWVPYDALVYQSAQGKGWKARAEEVLGFTSGLRVIAMHQEAFATDKGIEFAARVLHSGLVLWAVDESVSIKSHSAARTKNMMRLRDSAKYRRILTGTPVTRGVEDLYTQLRWLHDDIHGFSSFYSFRNFFCITQPIPGAPRGAVKITGYQNLDKLRALMEPWTLRMEAADCLDLPERIYQTRHVPITKEQERLYHQMRRDFLTQLQSGEIVTADIAAVKLLRMQQILCGHTRDTQGNWHFVDNERGSEALAAAEQANGKVVIWARFRMDINHLLKLFLHWQPAVWDGRTSIEDRERAKYRFMNDPDCRVFIGNPAAAGTGLDGLQRASHTMIYYSNSFKASDRWQSEARLFRDGQKGTVNVIDLVVPKTVDEQILQVLKNRKDVATEALQIVEDAARQLD